MIVFEGIILALHCLLDSTETHSLLAPCTVLPKMISDCGFLRGLISEKNSILGPSVGYEAKPDQPHV